MAQTPGANPGRAPAWPQSLRRLSAQIEVLDRRWIFVLVFASALLPMLFEIKLPLTPGRVVRSLYDAVARVPEGAPVIVSFDYGPSTATEMQPAALACLRHLESRHARIIGMAIWNEGANESRKTFKTWVTGAAARGLTKTYGVDYVNLGFKAGGALSLRQMATDLHTTFPKDVDGKPLASLPLMRDVHKLGDAALVLTFSSADPGIKQHVQVEATQLGIAVGGAVTAVSAPEMAPYVSSGQLVGLMGGLRGAAEYETLLGLPAEAVQGMNVQSAVHLTLVGLILLSNLAWLVNRRPQGGP